MPKPVLNIADIRTNAFRMLARADVVMCEAGWNRHGIDKILREAGVKEVAQAPTCDVTPVMLRRVLDVLGKHCEIVTREVVHEAAK